MTSTAETLASRGHLAATSAVATSHNTGNRGLRVSVAALRESLAHDQREWPDLAMRAGVGLPSLLYDWHNAWSTTASADLLANARVVRLLDESGTLIGLLPFAASRRGSGSMFVHRLGWPIEDLACPDHLDVPLLSAAAANAVVTALHAIRWDVLHLESLADDAPGARRLAAALAEHGCRVEWTLGEVCPYIDLPDSWDAYLASLSPTRRQTIRRKERALFREHATTLVDYAPDRLDEGWSHLIRLHHRQREQGSAFGPNEAELQRTFASTLAGAGRIWLTTLDVGGTPVAAWYGFAAGDTMCFYQCGRDPEWEHASVGQVLMGMMIRRAIEKGFRTFDFLRGDEPYKMTWTSTLRRDQTLVAYRRGLRGAVARRGDALMRAARRAARALRSRAVSKRSAGASS